jgi:Ion transport protein
MTIKLVLTLYCCYYLHLQDPWNVLDFFVVLTSLLTSLPNMPKMNSVRVFRVLRPLKSISALPGLQKLVVSMLKALPQLVSVVILLSQVMLIFGILGLQLFSGTLHARCR